MAFGNGPVITTNGLGWVIDAADRNSYPGSGTTWIDLVFQDDNITLTNGPTFSSDNGGVIVFDGVDDFGNTTDIPTPFVTVSTWVYKTSTSANQGIITRNNNFWAISQLSNTLNVLIQTIGSYQDTAYTIPLNQWTNIVYTYAGTGVSGSQVVYINGTSIFTAAGSGSMSTQRVRGNPVVVGGTSVGYWGGRIAQAQIYDRALSASEVLKNYNAQKSRFGL